MAEEKKHIEFTAAEIRRYHEGKLTPGEMHILEKAALEDPFLADALEGYAVEDLSLPADIEDLEQRLAARLRDRKVVPLAPVPSSFRWLRAAVMTAAIAGAALLVYQFGFNRQKKEIAQAQVKEDAAAEKNPSQKTGIISPLPDSARITPPTTGDDVAVSEKKNSPAKPETTAPTAKKESAREAPAETAAPPPPDNAAIEQLLTGKTSGLEITTGDRGRAEKLDSVSSAERMTQLKDERALAMTETALKKNKASVTTRNARSFTSANVFRGKVTDAQDNPLPFANITNRQDNIGTYSDAQGYFVLTSTDTVLNVQVRSLGFEKQNVQLQNNLVSNQVVLKDDRSLDEVVLSNKKVNSRLRENNMVLEEPEPADGWNNYDTYLANNLNVPDDFKKKSGGGEVSLSFEVNNLGEPVNIRVEKSLCEVCDKEAIRLLKEGPKWKRKARKGKRTTITIPF